MAVQSLGIKTNKVYDNKSPGIRITHHIWYISIIMILCSVLYYQDVILDLMGSPSPGWSIYFITHDLHLLLFSIPLLYAAYVFRMRGVVITGIITMLVYVPRAIFTAPYLEGYFRAMMFTAFVLVMGVLIAHLQSRRLQLVEAYGIVKQHEESLLIAETAIKTCVSAIATADLEGRLTYVNPAFVKIWGYNSPDEILGTNFVKLCKEEDKAQEVARSLLRGSDIESAELVGKKKDGSEFVIGLRASLIKDAKGQPIGITTSLADITGRNKGTRK
jgi:PAS domain S-box-containing protein